jgi:uncharacterized protein (DUF305 family)
MTSTTRRTAALLAAAALALAGCGEQDTTADSAIPESEPFNQADVDFATQMIPHHAQALLLVDTAAPRDDLSPEVASLVEKIRTEQTGEIELMTDWLEDWDQPIPDNPRDHGGMEHGSTDDMDMPGMATEEEMAALEAASGAEFEELWLEMMVEHHEGAITMAEREVDAGEYADAVSLADDIASTQADEVDHMEQLLGD